ncbi:MAG TPA: carboxypeptidase-like regulatory domain-containing protein [Gemmatimonadaceae bacterium]
MRRYVRNFLLGVASLAGLGLPVGRIGSQQATVIGRVVVKGSEVPVGYAVVSARPGAREAFTTGDGRFTFRGLPAGRVAITAKHVGYAPLDTVVTLGAADTIRMQLELSLITIQLPAVYSLAKACVHPGRRDPQVGTELAKLFEQMKENAERHRLLSQSYPFEMDVERRITKAEPSLAARFVAYDTIVRSSVREWRYAPGNMIGSREYTDGVFVGKWSTLTLPELGDFADERFLNNHCFDFGGVEVVDGDTLLRIDFVPAPVVRSPDVSGTIYLDPKTYQLRSTLISLVNLDKRLREMLDGQSVRAEFKEAIPGVPIVHRVSSMVFPRDDPKNASVEPSTEIHRTLSIRFLRGKP